MRISFFWKTWINDYRRIGYITGAVFIAYLLFVWYSYAMGAAGVTDWVKLQEQKVIETTVHSFQLGPFNLSVPADNYVVLEYFHGSHIHPNVWASYIFLFGLVSGSLLLLTVITTLEKLWYFVGMALFILFLGSLRFEVLGIFGWYNKAPDALALSLFIGTSFYFNRIRPGVLFKTRLLIFGLLAVLIGLIIRFFASVEVPFFHLTLTGYTGGVILSVLFIILVAHEIPAAFIYLAGQSNTRNLRHFSLLSLIYMINLILACFHELGVFTWEFLYLSPYLLLTISAVIGLWGFRQREILYQNILPFAPFGAYGYLALAIICFATTGQLLGNSNDPALKIIRDAILFSHTGYGIIFLVYVFSNYILLLARNLPVHKVLYNPTRMPYFTYRLAGMIAMLGFVFYSNWREYVYNGMAGFYNTTGDLYTLLGNDVYAEAFYEQGAQQGFQNNRSNYALATIKASRLNFDDAHHNYELANDLRPTSFSLTNAGNLYIWENRVPEAIKTYRDGLKQLEGSSMLENNLGFAYAKMHNLDTALMLLNQARNRSGTKVTAETNFFALCALELIPVKADSIVELFGSRETQVLANALALSTLQKEEFKTKIDPLKDKSLNLHTATLLNNYLIKYVKSVDTTFINKAYAIASDSVNEDFSEALKSSLAFAFYHQGNVSKALELLAELAYITQEYKGKFNYIMGLWALEQGNPVQASSYFTYADTYLYKDARFYNAIALSEAGRRTEAFAAWDSVISNEKGDLQIIGLQMKKILSTDPTDALKLSDPEKYQFCRYRIGLQDSTLLNRLLNTFENVDYKAQAILDISKKYYEADQLIAAIRFFNKIAGLQLTDKRLYDDISHFELLMLAQRRELPGLARQINKGVTFDSNHLLEKKLYTALIAESNGDTAKARPLYTQLASYNPYFEEGIIAASVYFKKYDKNKLRAYSVLAEAIQVNTSSIRLLRAYIAEAQRVGFDDYAYQASLRLRDLE